MLLKTIIKIVQNTKLGEKMKFWTRERVIAIIGFIIVCVGISGWQSVLTNAINNPDSKQNRASSKMTYGRFLEYLDMGWIKTVDFYDNGRIAVIEASSPELSDRIQKIKVEIPVGASPLIIK